MYLFEYFFFFTVDVVEYKCEKLKSLVGNVAICGRIVSIFDGGEEEHKSQQTCNTLSYR